MKKNLLALSIAAMVGGIAGGANAAVFVNTVGASNNAAAVAAAQALGLPAINVNAPAANTLRPTTSGIGHVLLVPYFSTQNSNKTLLSLTNTDTVNGKAVKLRFRGAANSDDLFDISIFLSPGDMWTADVGSDDGVISRIVTSDTSCTLPSAADIAAQGGKFKLNRVLGEDAKQTREGYVEILNMADIPPGTGTNGANSALFTAVKHVAGKAPCSQAVMDLQENELTLGAFNADGTRNVNTPLARGYSWPTGGLSANWILVNTSTTASFSGQAVALRAVPEVGGVAQLDGQGSGNIVWFPQTSLALTGATPAQLTADPLLTSAGFASQVANYDFPDLSTPYFTVAGTGAAVTPAVQADILADALATKSVINDVMTASGFATDWVFSMPTRRYAVALNYAASATSANRLLFRAGTGNGYFNPGNTGLNKNGDQACVMPGGQRAYDREENTKTTFVISPDSNLTFCGETSVLSFNNAGKTSVLGAQIARKDLNTTFAEGWFNINTTTTSTPNGLPIIGFAAAKSDGINLGGTWTHRTSR